MRTYVRQAPVPSSAAASSSSTGKSTKNECMISTVVGRARAPYAMPMTTGMLSTPNALNAW